LAAVVELGRIGDPRAVLGSIVRLGYKGGKFLGMGKGIHEFDSVALKQIGTPEALNAVMDSKLNKR
jgi:hypothetical protein